MYSLSTVISLALFPTLACAIGKQRRSTKIKAIYFVSAKDTQISNKETWVASEDNHKKINIFSHLFEVDL